METAETGGELLSTVHVSSGECRRQRRRRRGRAVAGGGNDRGRWWAALHYSHATWTVENVEGEGEEEEQWLAGERRRPVVSWESWSPLCFVVLCFCSSYFAPLFNVFINTVCNSAQKSNFKLLLVVLRFNHRCSWIPQTVMCV